MRPPEIQFGILPYDTDAFLRTHPGIEFDLDLNDRQVDLLAEGFDLAARIAELEDSSLIARPLAPVRHLVCASPAYLAEQGTPRTPVELAEHNCLIYANAIYPAPDTCLTVCGPLSTSWLGVSPASLTGTAACGVARSQTFRNASEHVCSKTHR
jgi:DNA-binding transcriptional LysR family regulator